MAQTTMTVRDISCEHCERTITEALAPLEGVKRVRVDIPEKRVHVDHDEQTTSVDRFTEVLQDEDYPVASAS